MSNLSPPKVLAEMSAFVASLTTTPAFKIKLRCDCMWLKHWTVDQILYPHYFFRGLTVFGNTFSHNYAIIQGQICIKKPLPIILINRFSLTNNHRLHLSENYAWHSPQVLMLRLHTQQPFSYSVMCHQNNYYSTFSSGEKSCWVFSVILDALEH